MFFVYILRSVDYKNQIYVGFTTNLADRLESHNTSCSIHTAKYKPWEIVTYTVFNNKYKALEFETYLKSGSGRAFIAKRLL